MELLILMVPLLLPLVTEVGTELLLLLTPIHLEEEEEDLAHLLPILIHMEPPLHVVREEDMERQHPVLVDMVDPLATEHLLLAPILLEEVLVVGVMVHLLLTPTHMEQPLHLVMEEDMVLQHPDHQEDTAHPLLLAQGDLEVMAGN
jgi:hypothetical protein